MFNGKRRSLFFESDCVDLKLSTIQTLLSFSFQVNQCQFDNNSVNIEMLNGITDGWKKVTFIHMPEQKNTSKLKKKINGQSRNLGYFGNYRFDRKKVKLLFTNNLKSIYNSESYEYIPLNGVYQVSKSAETFTDTLNYRKRNFGKRILLPLNEPIPSQKDVNLVDENINKTCCNSLEADNNFQPPKSKNASSSTSLSDLRISGDNPFTFEKKKLNNHQILKSKSADIKAKHTYATIFDKFKEMFFHDLVPREHQLGKTIYYNSTVYSQLQNADLVSAIELKSMMQKISQTNSNVSSHEINSILKTKGPPVSKKGNKANQINEMNKNLNSRHTYDNYNIIVQPNMVYRQQPDAFTEEVLPEIFGKKIKANPSIHRWL